MKYYNDVDLLLLLESKVKEFGSQRKLAENLEVSPAFLSDVLLGNRAISEKIASKLGFVREVIYYKEVKYLKEHKQC